MEIFGFTIVHGALDATKVSLVVIEQDRWYFGGSDHATVIQEPGSYG